MLHYRYVKPRGWARRRRCWLLPDENPRLQQQSAARRSDCGLSRPAADQGERAPLFRHGGVCRDPRKRPRRGRLRDPVDLVSGQRPPDGAAGLPRRAEARLGAAGDGGHPLLRLCPAGPQIRAAHPDLGQARRQHDHRRRRRPGADPRSPRRPDPGLLRHPDRQSVRGAGAGEGHPRSSRPPRSGHRLARCRRRLSRPADRPAARRRPRDHRQAARAGRRVRGHEHHRRRRRASLHPGRRHGRQRRHLVQCGRGLDRRRRLGGLCLCHPRRAVGRRGGAGRGARRSRCW